MIGAEEQLAKFGFGRRRGEPACWRTVRLDPPPARGADAQGRLDPVCSRAVLRWRKLLARRPLPPDYRITRAEG